MQLGGRQEMCRVVSSSPSASWGFTSSSCLSSWTPDSTRQVFCGSSFCLVTPALGFWWSYLLLCLCHPQEAAASCCYYLLICLIIPCLTVSSSSMSWLTNSWYQNPSVLDTQVWLSLLLVEHWLIQWGLNLGMKLGEHFLCVNFCFPLSTEDMNDKYELITIRLHSCEKVYFSQQSLMKQNTKGWSKGPLIIKKRREKRGKEKMARSPIFSSLFWNLFHSVFWIWFKLSLLSPALDLEREGERSQPSRQQT